MKLWTRFINGLAFGAGICLTLVMLFAMLYWWGVPAMRDNVIQESKYGSGTRPVRITAEAPQLKQEFLGSAEAYSDVFRYDDYSILKGGPGRITGRVLASGEPVKGLKIKLLLNRTAWSPWAVTDENGIYTIPVPYGEYRIHGYKLDFELAHQLLAGLIDRPGMHHMTNPFTVTSGQPGKGIDLTYVEPVQKSGPAGRTALDSVSRLIWKPYPGATWYRVQMFENSRPNDRAMGTPLFDPADRPVVQDSRLDVAAHKIELKPGHYYEYQVEAYDENGLCISQTSEHFPGYDFMITPR